MPINCEREVQAVPADLERQHFTAQLAELPDYPPVVQHEGNKKVVLGFVDATLLTGENPDEQRLTIEAVKRLQGYGFPMGMIMNTERHVTEIPLNGFILGPNKMVISPVSEDRKKDQSFEDSTVFPMLEDHQYSLDDSSALHHLSRNLKPLSGWDGLHGILPFVIANGGITPEVTDNIHEYNGKIFEVNESITDDIGKWIVSHREVSSW